MTLIQAASTDEMIPPPTSESPTLVWNEQRAAALLSFEEEETLPPAPIAAVSQPTVSPRDQTSKLSFGKSPFARLGLVATACLGVFAIAGIILNSMSKVTVPSSTNRAAQATEGAIPLDTILETGQTEKEKASLLTEAALGKQEVQLAALNPNRKPKQQPSQSQPVSLPSKASGSAIAVPPPPAAMPLPPPPTLSAIPPTAEPAIDPTQQWLVASTTGSYGQVERPAPPNLPVPAAMEWPAVNPAEEAAILNRQPIRQLVIGTQAPAKLITPILHEAMPPQNAEQPTTVWRFTVRLEAALSTTEGVVVLPAGTELTAAVASIGASGLLNLYAVAAVVEGREYKLPPQALSIRAAEGQPLMAQKYHDKGGEIAGMDTALVLFGSLAKVGELVNRPQSTASITTGLGGISTATQNPPVDLTAAALEGGFTLLSQQVSDRNQKALQETLNRPNLWFVPQGTPVQVFVNQTIQL